MGSVHFLEVKTKPAGRETVPELKTTSIGAVSHSEIDGKPAMDVGFRLGSNPSAVIINSEGFVYERLLEGSSEIRCEMAPIRCIVLSDVVKTGAFGPPAQTLSTTTPSGGLTLLRRMMGALYLLAAE